MMIDVLRIIGLIYLAIAAAHFIFILMVYLSRGGDVTVNDRPAPQFVVFALMSIMWPFIKWKTKQ
jgi:hypothetical protein